MLDLPPHPVAVTTRKMTFFVGNPYKPSCVTVTGWGGRPNVYGVHFFWGPPYLPYDTRVAQLSSTILWQCICIYIYICNIYIFNIKIIKKIKYIYIYVYEYASSKYSCGMYIKCFALLRDLLGMVVNDLQLEMQFGHEFELPGKYIILSICAKTVYILLMEEILHQLI